jgi:F-type H+-transporting ATPase subunit b
MNPSEVFNPTGAEFWVLIGLLIFFGVLIFAGVPKAAMKAIDGRRQSIQDELDEAARIRAEAQALLDSLKQKRLETERQANEMLANAEAEARRFETEARERLEESLRRREELAERKIAQAEAQASAEVKAAAVDAAAQIAEQVLKGRLKGKRSDRLVDEAVAQMAAKLS